MWPNLLREIVSNADPLSFVKRETKNFGMGKNTQVQVIEYLILE